MLSMGLVSCGTSYAWDLHILELYTQKRCQHSWNLAEKSQMFYKVYHVFSVVARSLKLCSFSDKTETETILIEMCYILFVHQRAFFGTFNFFSHHTTPIVSITH